MTDMPAGRNHALKEDIRAYWGRRAVSFDSSPGHVIEDGAEAPEWRRLLVAGLGPLEGRRVLDLACGTGEISRMLLGLGAEVTGIDFAEPMLERARAKHRGGAFAGRLADVENLAMEEDGSYDAVVTRHLVWTLTDPHAAFAEWFRVLRPGGRLLIVDGDWVDLPLRRRFMRMLADRFGSRASHADGVDPAEHARIIARVHYAEGLRPGHLEADLAAHGFADFRRHGLVRLSWWGMRRVPLAERLRLAAPRRFAVSAGKVV